MEAAARGTVSNVSNTDSNDSVEVLLDDRPHAVEAFGRHSVAAQLELVHEPSGNKPSPAEMI